MLLSQRSMAAGLVAVCAAGAFCTNVKAGPITFSGSSSNLAASATFDMSGTDLVITLANTSASDVLVPADVLTAVFFDIDASPPLSLGRVSAVLGAGSTVLFGPAPAGGVVGGEWAYAEGLVGAPGGAARGISSSGFGLFGPSQLFPGSVLTPPTEPDGLDYGITSAGDNPATGNAPVTGGFPLIKDQVVFKLSGLPAGFNPAAQIRNVIWQYGTALDEPHFPEPATAGLLALGGLAALRRRSSRGNR